jgi:hypothetical protein
LGVAVIESIPQATVRLELVLEPVALVAVILPRQLAEPVVPEPVVFS